MGIEKNLMMFFVVAVFCFFFFFALSIKPKKTKTIKDYWGLGVNVLEVNKKQNRVLYQYVTTKHKHPVWIDIKSFKKYISDECLATNN